MSEKYQCIKTTAKNLKEIYKNETMDKIFEDFAEALNDYQDFGCELCKAQDKLEDKIADLEHRLANSIEPKFKVGQEVWFIDGKIVCGEVEEFEYVVSKYKEFYNYFIDGYGWLLQKQLFSTESEAKSKLREMQDE